MMGLIVALLFILFFVLVPTAFILTWFWDNGSPATMDDARTRERGKEEQDNVNG